ncbi:MAG: hypothetical protein ACXAD7_13305 [Candidatus Kariarchaeaceae archaeon]|jgi:hypothetical protein
MDNSDESLIILKGIHKWLRYIAFLLWLIFIAILEGTGFWILAGILSFVTIIILIALFTAYVQSKTSHNN